jgi:hypothetical protein
MSSHCGDGGVTAKPGLSVFGTGDTVERRLPAAPPSELRTQNAEFRIENDAWGAKGWLLMANDSRNSHAACGCCSAAAGSFTGGTDTSLKISISPIRDEAPS